jgi:hypothetical protein
MSNVKYYFLGDTSLARTNVITIAYETDYMTGANGSKIPVVTFGVAFSSKVDVYSKKVGKRIAVNRMRSQPRRECLENFSFYCIEDAMFKNILNNEAPTWACCVIYAKIDFAYNEQLIIEELALIEFMNNHLETIGKSTSQTPKIIQENWWGAVEYAKEHCHNGWRLPTTTELKKLNLDGEFWACDGTDDDRSVFFSNGFIYRGDKSDTHNVILVRN